MFAPITFLIVFLFTNSCNTDQTYVIGQSYQGGVIAYIFQSGDAGYVSGQTHGLIAAPSDQSPGLQWGCLGSEISGATSAYIGSGNQNTIDILNSCSVSGTAARLCGNLVLGGYNDWYLPSKDELNKLYINKDAITGFTSNLYWSSTQNGSDEAWTQNFDNGSQASKAKSYPAYVRAVRTF